MHFFLKTLILITIIIAIDGNKPKLVNSPSDVYGLSNQQVSLRCESENSSDKILWIKDEKVIQTDSKLLVFQLNLESEGYYLCNVTNNFGWSMSEKALVRIAYLQPFPEQNISDQYASPGATVLLQCPPIEGLPKPSIDWQGNISLSDTRFKMDSGHNLRIDLVKRSDAGLYWCRAKNLAFSRLSSPTRLIVAQKPLFLLLPKHIRVMQGSSVLFPCLVTGESPLAVHWYKLAASVTDPSLGRASLATNCSLLLTNNVRLHHSGAYVARAYNIAGITEIVYRLAVISPPSFIETPSDNMVLLGHSITLPCTTTGTPSPNVFWHHNGEYLLADSDTSESNEHTRVTIFDNGTLFITNVRSRDAGLYHCYAASFVGISRTHCSLAIHVPTNMFAPVISILPQNVTITEGGIAILVCRVLDSALVTVTWYKQSLRIIGLNSPRGRLHLLANGDLRINDCKIQDSAKYTCRASIGSIYSDWSAHLTVKSYSEAASDSLSDGSLTPVTTATIVNITVEFVGDTYLLLKWDLNHTRHLHLTSVEIAPQFVSGWTQVANTKDTKILINNLKPDTGYKILLRSPHSLTLLPDVVYTLDKPTISQDSTFLDFHKSLQDIEVFSVKLDTLSSSQVHLSWKVRGSVSILRSVSGFIIKTEPISIKRCLLMTQKLGQSLFSCLDNEDGINIDDLVNSYDDKDLLTTLKVQKYVVHRSVVRERTKSSAIIGNLRPFVCYEVEIETFIDHIKAGRISGRDSVTKTVLTYDDLPAKPPKIKSYKWIDNNTFFVSWQRLDSRHSNGPITGYIIQVVNVAEKSLQTLKASINVFEYQIRIASPLHRHILYLSANSCRGPGPRSWPIYIQHQSHSLSNNDVTVLPKPWIIASVVGASICAIFLILILIFIFICKRQRSNSNNAKLGHIALVSAKDKEMEESFSNLKKLDKHHAQKLLSNYDTLSPNFLTSSDGFSSENCPSSCTTTTPRFACGSEDHACNESLAYASSSIIYKGCQHYNQPGMNKFPPNFYGPYIDIINDHRNLNMNTTESSLILNPIIPPPPLYPPPPAPKNQSNYPENDHVTNSKICTRTKTDVIKI